MPVSEVLSVILHHYSNDTHVQMLFREPGEILTATWMVFPPLESLAQVT